MLTLHLSLGKSRVIAWFPAAKCLLAQARLLFGSFGFIVSIIACAGSSNGGFSSTSRYESDKPFLIPCLCHVQSSLTLHDMTSSGGLVHSLVCTNVPRSGVVVLQSTAGGVRKTLAVNDAADRRSRPTGLSTATSGQDAPSNAFAGPLNTQRHPPVLVSQVPAAGATTVSKAADIVLTFNEPMAAGTG